MLHPLLHNIRNFHFLENIENIKNIMIFFFFRYFDTFEYIMIFCNPVVYAEIAILSQYLVSLRTVNAATGYVLSTRFRRTTVPQVVTLMAGSKRRSLLMAGEDDEIFVIRRLSVTPKTTVFDCTQ